MSLSFVFDANKCTGCQACQLACTIENNLVLGKSWRWVDTYNPRRHPEVPVYHLSLACNHCAQAPCQQGCPASAFQRDPTTGALLLDTERCVGCKYCAWVCPYDAPKFDAKAGVMTKCTFCNPRLQEGLPPACVALCPTGALGFAELSEVEIIQAVAGFPQTVAVPRVKISPLGRRGLPPELTAPAGTSTFDARDDLPDSRISWRTEWSLVVFTLLAAVLVAAWTAARLGSLILTLVPFGLVALVGVGLSALHLGQRQRAPRAMANLAQSWLSREVLLVTLFYGLATATLAWSGREPGPGSSSHSDAAQITGWVLAGLGFLALAAIDQVYRDVQRSKILRWHSAHTVLTGLYLAGILGHQPILAAVAGMIKLGLYVSRKLILARGGENWRPVLVVIRLVLGFVVPLVVWLVHPASPGNLAAKGVNPAGADIIFVGVSVLLAELIDRCEYYTELEVTTPARQMALHLASKISA